MGTSGQVVSVEASFDRARNLEKNVAINGLNNVRVLNMAVSDVPGRLKLYRGTAYNPGFSSTVSDRGQGVEQDVDAQPLDVILTEDEISRARIIKIDVDGAEERISRTLPKIFGNLPADAEFIVEIVPSLVHEADGLTRKIAELFENAGYAPYQLTNDYSADSYFRFIDDGQSIDLVRFSYDDPWWDSVEFSEKEILFTRAVSPA